MLASSCQELFFIQRRRLKSFMRFSVGHRSLLLEMLENVMSREQADCVWAYEERQRVRLYSCWELQGLELSRLDISLREKTPTTSVLGLTSMTFDCPRSCIPGLSQN